MDSLEKIAQSLNITSASFASLMKAALRSRKCSHAKKPTERQMMVLGNGPSLKETLQERAVLIKECDLTAVNFAANSPEFTQLEPKYYVLADPHFFNGEKTDSNVAKLWENLMAVKWPITIFVPAKEGEKTRRRVAKRGNISVATYNMTAFQGWHWLEDIAYRKGWGMPRPRNVLIPALMIALREGYRKIFVAGADHSWSKTLWVDDQNRVISIQPHFYPDKEEERARVAEAYKGIKLHEIYNSFAVAFRSYFDIARFAQKLKAEIINITPGSFIDAFPRG